MATALQWSTNPLFRLLAFLDNVGLQDFVLRHRVCHDEVGTFRDAELLFADSSIIHAILRAGVVAFRENILHLVRRQKERLQLLTLTGVDGTQPWSSTTSSSMAQLPLTSSWSEAMLRPASLAEFVNSFATGFDATLLKVLATSLQLDDDDDEPGDNEEEKHPSSCARAVSAKLAEQFLIDAVDRWMSSLDATKQAEMVQACGVQPPIVAAAQAKLAEIPFALVDFVIDVLYPWPLMNDNNNNNNNRIKGRSVEVLDWVLLSYEKNREAVDVEEEVVPTQDTNNNNNTDDLRGAKRRRSASSAATSASVGVDDGGLQGWVPADGEEVLTEENLERFMRERPADVPKDILRDARRHWSDPAITEFELSNHYTAAELRDAVKKILSTQHDDNDECTSSIRRLGPELLVMANKATRKAQFVEVLLRIHAE